MKPLSSKHKWYLEYALIKQASEPHVIAPMKLKKLTSVDAVLKDHKPEDLIVQQKIDGFKTQAIKTSAGAEVYTRRGENFSANVKPLIAELSKKMHSGDFLLGELAWLKDGKQYISDIQTVVGSNPEKAEAKLKEKGQLVLYVYDMLWHNGKDITKESYTKRYAALKSEVGSGKMVQVVKNYTWAEKDKAMKDALAAGGEGIVIKTKDSKYNWSPKGSSEKTGEWFKFKPGAKAHEEDVIVKSYTIGEGGKAIFPAYQYDNGSLFEVGKVSGLPKDKEAEIKKKIDDGKIVVIEVGFQEVMESGKFRHMSWHRERPDKSAKEVKKASISIRE